MYIKNIELKDYRNYESLSLEFDEKLNIFLGRNAQGKTNLLEAIYITALGKSFRTNKDTELIRFDQEFAKVKIEKQKDEIDGSVEIIFNKNQKKYAKVDGQKIRRTSELLENVYIVIFSPEDLKIVKDEPEKRRKFIDRELCQIRPAYYENLSNYKKTLVQRNAYLKEFEIDKSALDIWDCQLARYGARIMKYRSEFIERISEFASNIHSGITGGKENLRIVYAPNVEEKENVRTQEDFFYEIIKKSQENDLRQRSTTRGPHKDDIEFFIDDINARSFGSQGQQRTAALSLKLAEIDIIKEVSGHTPILLLDDVMSELDLQRQEFLVKTLSGVQLFITTTEISDKLLAQLPKGNIYYIDSGKVRIEDVYN